MKFYKNPPKNKKTKNPDGSFEKEFIKFFFFKCSKWFFSFSFFLSFFKVGLTTRAVGSNKTFHVVKKKKKNNTKKTKKKYSKKSFKKNLSQSPLQKKKKRKNWKTEMIWNERRRLNCSLMRFQNERQFRAMAFMPGHAMKLGK